MRTIIDICQEMIFDYTRMHSYVDREELCFRMGYDTYAKLRIESDGMIDQIAIGPESIPVLLGIQVLRAEDSRAITLERFSGLGLFIRVELPTD